MAARKRAAFKGQQPSGDDKIGINEEWTIAVKAYSGRIPDEGLEKEEDGSGLRYSSDIKATGSAHEVGIDAVTGAVLGNWVEGDNPD